MKIGQLHTCSDDRADFDMLYFAETDVEVIKSVKLDMVQRLADADGADIDLDQLQALLAANTEIELAAWFDEHYAYFSFNIFGGSNDSAYSR